MSKRAELWLERRLDQMRREECVWCPHCGAEYEDDECVLITYHGDIEHEATCDSCGEDFHVNEIVRRTYETSKMEDDDGA